MKEALLAAVASIQAGDPDLRPYFKAGRVAAHAIFAAVPTFFAILVWMLLWLQARWTGWLPTWPWLVVPWLLFTLGTLFFLLGAIFGTSRPMTCPACSREWDVMGDMTTFSCWACGEPLRVEDGELVAERGRRARRQGKGGGG